ncbi:MAG: translation initiation factor [Bacteroidia bacterium]|nr:translation initiation factor [Bacteroidia bacterium]MCX7651343.1 translation initiation factor [Bacteroidia bacterium]MDW8417137.1 translation initiation factor [Bacteroidia bacterium]
MSTERKWDRLVYSTRPLKEEVPEEPQTPSKQNLRVQRRRIAGGKEVTEVMGYIGRAADMEALAKRLRQNCATGGSISDGKIILQGDQVEKVIKLLQKEGHIVKRSGG